MKNNYIDNPIIAHDLQSIEKEEMKENNLINKLFKRNLKRLIKKCKEERLNEIICLKGYVYIR